MPGDANTLCGDCGRLKQSQRAKRCDECRRERRLETERERNRKPHRTQRPARNWTRLCAYCRKTFTTTGAAKYCSDGCRPAPLGATHGPFIEDIGQLVDKPAPPSHFPACGFCGRNFPAWDWRQKWCSQTCKRYGLTDPSDLSVAVSYGDCRRCGRLFCRPSVYGALFCSRECSDRHEKTLANARRRTHKRAGENFTLREIAERDGWRCHLCGGKVPDRKYAARDKDPTIDHLIPVADGGEHTRQNVALAHNRCNYERSNEGAAQLRLVG